MYAIFHFIITFLLISIGLGINKASRIKDKINMYDYQSNQFLIIFFSVIWELFLPICLIITLGVFIYNLTVKLLTNESERIR